MNRIVSALPLLVFSATLALSGVTVSAKGLVITSGEKIAHLADLPDAPTPDGHPVKLGYKYSHFGVFWLSLWTWGGEYCLYHDRTVYEANEEQMSKLYQKPVAEAGKPFGYRVPIGLLVLVGGVGLLIVVGKLGGDDGDERLGKIIEDPRYEKALEIIQKHGEKMEEAGVEDENDDGGFEEAVQYLMSQGVPREEAQQNLALLIHAIVTHAESQ